MIELMPDAIADDPGTEDVLRAQRRISRLVHRTPTATCASLDDVAGARLVFKCEHLQKAGAFKSRGACNAVYSLSDEVAARGVATHSSGNHAGALARAAGLRGIACTIVMPDNAPPVKRAAVEGYGARIVTSGPTLADREARLEEVIADAGAHFVHPYHDPAVIAGQGTAARELIEDHPDLDAVLAPLGGGGLLSGTTIALKGTNIDVIGAEPELADDARRSLATGELQPQPPPVTVADGLRTALSPRTFRMLKAASTEVVCCPEAAIIEAMRLLWTRAKLLVEASAAVPLAAILANPERFTGLKVGIILSGGNVDLDHLPWS